MKRAMALGPLLVLVAVVVCVAEALPAYAADPNSIAERQVRALETIAKQLTELNKNAKRCR